MKRVVGALLCALALLPGAAAAQLTPPPGPVPITFTPDHKDGVYHDLLMFDLLRDDWVRPDWSSADFREEAPPAEPAG